MKTVSIVIPVFNEENIVEELIFRLKNATHNLRYSFEFVCVHLLTLLNSLSSWKTSFFFE